MPSSLIRSLNLAMGALVVAIGAWLAWNSLSGYGVAALLFMAASFLWWQGRTVLHIWAWSTLLLGVESLAWPIATMLHIRSAGGEPSDDEMGAILSATLMGLFSAVFWIAFSYGLFTRAKERSDSLRPQTSSPAPPRRQPPALKKR
jgi:hypothetical protein